MKVYMQARKGRGLLFVLGLTLCFSSANALAEDYDTTLIMMGDLHATLVPHAAVMKKDDGTEYYATQAGGLAKLTTLINEVRADNPDNLLLAVGDTPLVTAATASLATLSNVGPGLAEVGPTGNFAFFAGWQKIVMVLLMWLGRLEFFSVLALLLPALAGKRRRQAKRRRRGQLRPHGQLTAFDRDVDGLGREAGDAELEHERFVGLVEVIR